MRKNEKKQLKNYFELQAIYLREFKEGNITKDDFINRIALMSKNTIYMLNIEE